MSRSGPGSILRIVAKAADRAIRETIKERKREAKALESDMLALKRIQNRNEKQLRKNGKSNSENLYQNPISDALAEQSKHTPDETQEQKSLHKEAINKLSAFSKKGASLEKAGKVSHAIREYQQAVFFGETNMALNFTHYAKDVERLIILYRKQKEYHNEMDTINLALSHQLTLSQENKYRKRLSEVDRLMTISQRFA